VHSAALLLLLDRWSMMRRGCNKLRWANRYLAGSVGRVLHETADGCNSRGDILLLPSRHDADCGVSPEDEGVSSQHHKLDILLVVLVALGSSLVLTAAVSAAAAVMKLADL
jgi:hypothetical protein